MLTADRKKIVANLLSRSKDASLREAEIITSEKNPTLEFVHAHLRAYILFKFMLGESCQEDDLKELATLSLERTMKLDRKILRELDQATPCNHATAESTKKVLLLYAIQRDLTIKPDPARLAASTTVTGLAQYVHSLLPGNA